MAVLLVMLVLAPPVARGDEPSVLPQRNDASEPPPAEAPPQAPPETSDGASGHGEAAAAEPAFGAKSRPHGDEIATILTILLGCILILAVGVFAFIVIWGRRVRRTLREAPKPTSPRDELWYLKPKAGLPPDSPKSE